MNKEQFLTRLKKELTVLKEAERIDIIEEYSGYIDEKILAGKTEEEAIEDFGDFNELVAEILDAYQISSDYKKDNFQNAKDDFKKGFEKVTVELEEAGREVSKKFSEFYANELEVKNISDIIKEFMYITLKFFLIWAIFFGIYFLIFRGVLYTILSPISSMFNYVFLYRIFEVLFSFGYVAITLLIFIKYVIDVIDIFKTKPRESENISDDIDTSESNETKSDDILKDESIVKEEVEKNAVVNDAVTTEKIVSEIPKKKETSKRENNSLKDFVDLFFGIIVGFMKIIFYFILLTVVLSVSMCFLGFAIGIVMVLVVSIKLNIFVLSTVLITAGILVITFTLISVMIDLLGLGKKGSAK